MPPRPPLSAFEDAGQTLQKLPERPPLSAFDTTSPIGGKIPSAQPMSAMESVVTGMGQPILGAEQVQAHIAGPEQASRMDQAIKQRDLEFQQRGGSPLLRGLGAAASTAPLALTGAGGLPGAIAGGALSAGAMPTNVPTGPQMFEPTGSPYLDAKIKEMTLGGIFGGLGTVAGRTAAGVLSPTLSKEAKVLQDAGVNLTPGQMYGGKGLEEVAQKFPTFGNFIRGAYGRQADSFRRAVGDQVLEPIGQKLDPKAVGRNRIEDVGNKIDVAYHSVLPQITATPDQPFINKLGVLNRFAGELPASARDQFTKILDNRLGPLFGSYGTGPNGHIYKQADSALRHLADKNIRSPDAGQQEMGRLLHDVREALRDLAIRQNPTLAPQLKAVDKSYALYMRMVDASVRRAGSGGEFTPADLIQAVAKGQKRGAFKTGDALMQTFAEAANSVMPGKVQSQLGPTEYIAGTLAAGGIMHDPMLAAAIAGGGTAAGVPYTKPVMDVMNALARNPSARGAASIVRKGSPYAAVAAQPLEREYTYGGPQE